MITQAELDNWFTYHAPTTGQIEQYAALRSAAKTLAEELVRTPAPDATKREWIDTIRGLVMWANASIACDSGGPPPSRGA